MRPAVVVAFSSCLFLASGRARAASDALAPSGGGLGALAVHVDLAGARVLYRTCPGAPCATDATSTSLPITLDRALLPEAAEIETLPIGGGRSAVHVRIPARGGAPIAWEAVLVAGALPVFADITGYAHGEEGERTGQVVQIRGDDDVKHVLVGQVREDLHICGKDPMTILAPRGLDPSTLELRGASVQRLPAEQRRAATQVIASARKDPPDRPLAPLLVPVGASSAVGSYKAVADGDPTTTWSEARPGAGQGEFVMLRAPHEVPIARFSVIITPPSPKPEGASPRRFFLVADADTIAVTLPDDAWMHPGVAYDVPLSTPLRTSCIALVLDDHPYDHGRPHPEVTVAELTAYSAFDGPSATLEAVARALDGGGARAEAAMGVLSRAGSAGFSAMEAAYDKLDAAGRGLAIGVATSSPCEASAPLLLRAAKDADREVRRKAADKLGNPLCAKAAVDAFIKALDDASLRAEAAPRLARIAPSRALAPLAATMGAGDSVTRTAVRDAFARAARSATPEALEALLAASRSPDARLELLRASLDRLPEIRGPADSVVEALMAGNPSMRTRYLLVEPLARLARAGDASAGARFVASLAQDLDGPVRAHAAELAGAWPGASKALVAAVGDREPRVRESALHSVREGRVVAATEAAKNALEHDEWTFVRTSAAAALGALPQSEPIDHDLGKALAHDTSPLVRVAVIRALSERRATSQAGAIAERLEDEHEELDVRVAAVKALGTLCYRKSLDTLTSLAKAGADPLAEEGAQQLSDAALEALGVLHPADLASRLSPLLAKGARPGGRNGARRALAEVRICGK